MLTTIPNGYKRFDTKVGDIYHCLILHKAAIFNEEKITNPVIVAPDGDIRKAVGRYLTAKYPLPIEWEDKYYDIFNTETINITKNPLMSTWSNVKMVKLSSVRGITGSLINDDTVKQGIELGIKRGLFFFSGSGAVFDPSWSMKEFLKANTATLAAQVKKVKPRHDPETDKLHPAIGQMERIPFRPRVTLFRRWKRL
jgi:hypothetical protein